MNEYSKHEIEKFFFKFSNNTFEQADVAHFFVTSRDYSNNGSIIREVGDFLAHPKKKEKGIVLRSIKEIMPKFEEILENERLDKVSTEPDPIFSGLGTDQELINDLNHIFSAAGINTDKIDRSSNSFREFLFCTIFLLSTFKIEYRKKLLSLEVIYSHSLSLVVRCESTKYKNNFALLPVLCLLNVWTNAPSIPTHPEHKLERHLARRFTDGYLAAISYEKDKVSAVCEAGDFNRGEAWPCPQS